MFTRTMRFLVVVFISAFASQNVSAQEIGRLAGKNLSGSTSRSITSDDVKWTHITPALITSEEGQSALREYQFQKNNGLFPARKGGSNTLGEKKNFSVLNIKTNIESNVEFTLMAEESTFNLWVETSQLVANGGRVTSTDISQLAAAAGTQTPTGSVNPSKGIIALNEQVFGPPSDVDSNGKMEILLHDIKDFYDPANGNNSAIGGFFYPKDLISPNRQDIIHLDTVPGMYSLSGTPKSQTDLQQTLAHEYEHLIMSANKGSEAAFVSEGQAEWAEVATGYTPRSINYLNSSVERARSLLSFREDQPYGGPDSEDYQRGGLWTNYLADQLGWKKAGLISRTNGQGASTYINMLNSSGLPVNLLEDYVLGFHVANLINDRSTVGAFGYKTPSRTSVKVTGVNTIDGQSAVGTVKSATVNSGSVVYQQWSNVGSFTLSMDTSPTSRRGDVKGILIFDSPNGTRSFEPFSAGGEGISKVGNFESVYLVVAHVDLTASAAVNFNYTATWSDYTGTSSFENIVYDTGTVHHQASGNSVTIIGDSVPSSSGGFFAANDKFANRFNVPVGGSLVEVSVSMMFLDHFGESNSTVRDFKLSVWDNEAGKPGNVIASETVTYTASITAPTLTYQTVSLAAHQNVLKNVSGPLYVSIENAGTDNNYMYFIVAYSNESTSPSFMYNRFGGATQRWASFDALTSGGQPAFPGQIVPIRAKIDLNAGSSSSEDDIELPRFVTLGQNYPNPFNPSTSIEFSIPSTSLVQLDVFDLMGRKVATVQNGVVSPGTHSIRFDASKLSSGIYLYMLTAGDTKLTRTMTVIK